MPGLEPRRADLAVAGAILLDEILRRLGADEITLCDLSLREGLVLDYISRHRKEIAQADRYPDVRRRSVVRAGRALQLLAGALAARRAAVDRRCSIRRARIHGLTDREREWLEYAAILHDIGVHISYEGHHKHSYYLVKNGDLRGFEPDEIEAIALVARYHRQATPKREHDGFVDRCGGAPAGRCARSRRSCGWPRASIAATPRPSPVSSSTIAATTTCCSCAPPATRSWNSGPPRAMPRHSND